MKKFAIDFAERVIATAAVTFLSAISLTDLSDGKALLAAGGAALLTAVKAAVRPYVVR